MIFIYKIYIYIYSYGSCELNNFGGSAFRHNLIFVFRRVLRSSRLWASAKPAAIEAVASSQ